MDLTGVTQNNNDSILNYSVDQNSSNGLPNDMTPPQTAHIPSAQSTTKRVRKPRSKKVNKLSDHQVRVNHVSSEKRRREMIRSTYDDLVEMVPGLEATESRSELIIYLKTMAYLKWLYAKNKRLRDQAQSQGAVSEQELIDKGLIWELEDGKDLPSPPQEET
ncbi:protein Ino4p [Monosporozyma servazzii]